MAEAGGRKPAVLLVALAVVVVLLFGAGVAFGGGGTGDGGWRERLAGVGAGAGLAPADLVLGEGCALAGDTLGVAGGCVLEVLPEGGRFSLAPTRRATLLAGESGVRLFLSVEGQRMEFDVDPGEDADLTFSRSGGSLAIACRGALTCQVRLLPPS